MTNHNINIDETIDETSPDLVGQQNPDCPSCDGTGAVDYLSIHATDEFGALVVCRIVDCPDCFGYDEADSLVIEEAEVANV